MKHNFDETIGELVITIQNKKEYQTITEIVNYSSDFDFTPDQDEIKRYLKKFEKRKNKANNYVTSDPELADQVKKIEAETQEIQQNIDEYGVDNPELLPAANEIREKMQAENETAAQMEKYGMNFLDAHQNIVAQLAIMNIDDPEYLRMQGVEIFTFEQLLKAWVRKNQKPSKAKEKSGSNSNNEDDEEDQTSKSAEAQLLKELTKLLSALSQITTKVKEKTKTKIKTCVRSH